MAFNQKILQGLRPNLFELLAQENMAEALPPAIRYLFKAATNSFPFSLGRLVSHVDELWFVLEGSLQMYFIYRHDASLSENFYDLKRVSSQGEERGRLCTSGRIKSFLCLVVVPYLLHKLHQHFIHLVSEDDHGGIGYISPQEDLMHFIKFLFLNAYPYLQSAWEGMRFIFRLKYLFQDGEWYSPLLWASGLKLMRNSEMFATSTNQSVMSRLQQLVGVVMQMAVFGLKFLEWWYSGDRGGAVRKATTLPVPPPPASIQPHPQGVHPPADPTLCPLCKRPHCNPTVLLCSGYVFCYACIFRHMQARPECPVTLLHSNDSQLVRIYTKQ